MANQVLITSEIKKAAKKYPLYSQDGKQGDAKVIARLFTPYSNYTWYILELNAETGEAFGYVVGPEPEYGYICTNELQQCRQKVRFFGKIIEMQAVERDVTIKPCQETLESLLKQHNEPLPRWWDSEDKKAEEEQKLEFVEY